MNYLCDIWEGNDITDISKAKSFFTGMYLRLWGGNRFVTDYKDKKFDKFKSLLNDNGMDWGIYTCIAPALSPQENYDKIMKIYPEDNGKYRTMIDIEIAPPDEKKGKGSLLADETQKTIELLKKGFGHNPWIYTGDWYWNPTLWYNQTKKVNGKIVYDAKGNPVQVFSYPPWQDEYEYILAQYYWASSVNGDFTSYNQLKPYIPISWCKPLSGSTKEPLGWQFSGDQFSVPGFAKKMDFIMVKYLNRILKNPLPETEIIPEEKPTVVEIVDASKDKLLEVSYVSQLSVEAKRFNNDCGAASCSMIIKTYGKNSPTVDELYVEAVPNLVDRGLSIYDMQKLLSKHGVESSIKWTHSAEDIISAIDASKPVIAVIKYKYLQQSGYCEKGITFQKNHILIVAGYNDTTFILNDPLYYDNNGKNIRVPKDIFIKALSDKDCGMTIIPTKPYNYVSQNLPYKTYKVTVPERNVRLGAGTNFGIAQSEERHMGDKVQIDYSFNNSGVWGHIYGTIYWVYMAGGLEEVT